MRREFLEDIEGIENLLQVSQLDFPRALLALDGHLKRGGGRPVPAAGIEETELKPLQSERSHE